MSTLISLSKENHKKTTAPVKIMQFGEGNFLRAFVDWFIQNMNDSGKYEGHVVVVQPLPQGRVQNLQDQDGLYTLILQGINESGKAVIKSRIIDVLDDFVNPYTEYTKFLKYASSPDLEVVISNTTEAGIYYEPKDVECDFASVTPLSYPGKLLAGLKARYVNLKGDKPLAIIPCELIDDNGIKLKEVLIRLANARKEEAGFIDYITNKCHYTTTLVDRIVPGFPRANFTELCEKFGYVDNNMVKGEYFHLYVLQHESFVEEKFPVHQIGLNAIYVDDVHPYKKRKVRILNGAHSSLVPVAYLAGFEEVGQSLSNKIVNKFLLDEINQEIVPTVQIAGVEKFATDVIDRFLNPFVNHKLMSIALNSITKYKERDLPTLLDNLKDGKKGEHLCFALAALICFYRGYRIKDGKKEAIALNDNPKFIEEFKSYWNEYDTNNDVEILADKALSNTEFWGMDLTTLPELKSQVINNLKLILSSKDGYSALKEFVENE